MTIDLPNRALSIRQPWAWLVANGWKDIENRDWKTQFRGPVLIHASLKLEGGPNQDLLRGDHPASPFAQLDESLRLAYTAALMRGDVHRGGIVGVAEIVDCVETSPSPWFVGNYGFVIRNARPLPFMPLKGALGFFKAEYLPPLEHAA